MTALIHSHTMRVPARVHRGKWVVDCPVCTRAGRVAGLSGLICPECGARLEVVWPSEAMQYGIARVLAMRPYVRNQNWIPGETLHDLMRQNAVHGIFSALEPSPTGVVFGVTDDGVGVDGLLPAVEGVELKAIS